MGFESKDKMVNKPSHYIGKYGMEVNDVIENFCADLTGKEAVEKANAIKYILRYDKKNGVQDLEKAMTNIQYIIDRKEKEKPTSGRYHWERENDNNLRFKDLFNDERKEEDILNLSKTIVDLIFSDASDEEFAEAILHSMEVLRQNKEEN